MTKQAEGPCKNFRACGNDTAARTGYCSSCWGAKISKARHASLKRRRHPIGDSGDRVTVSAERLTEASVRLDRARQDLARDTIEVDEALGEWKQLLGICMRNGIAVEQLRDRAVEIARRTERMV